tara:strand:+ start:351 stop:689 length:339 start_codon:yes stop_codon:yes gene_type:complete
MDPTINYKFKDKKFSNTKKKQNNSYKLNYTDMEYIKFIYNKLHENTDNDNNDNLNNINNINNTKISILNDCMELFESQINELYTKQEELYSLIHTQQQQIEKITAKLSENDK